MIKKKIYVVNTKSSGKRNVLVLSTLYPILGVTKDDGKCKPAIIKAYEYTKGGTDIVDQKMGKYSVKPKSNKWTVAHASYLFDVARVNASTLHLLNQNKCPKTHSNESFKIGWKLAMSLIFPQLHHRHNNSNGLQRYTQKAIADLLGIQIVRPPTEAGTRKRLEEVVGEGQKRKKDAIGKTVSCGEALCTSHFQKMCPACVE